MMCLKMAYLNDARETKNKMNSFKLKKTDPIFSAPLSMFEIDNSASLNKKLISESRAWRKEQKGANISNHGDSWHSPDGLMMRSDPGFSEISKIIPQIAAQYALQINPKLDIQNFRFEANAWVNINRQGGYNTVHHHGKYHASGVYYIKQPEKTTDPSGMIELINSRFDHHIYSEIGGQAFAPSVKMRPPVGSMLVFPSTLLHFVYPNEAEEERISLAWNLRFIRK